MKYPKLRSEHSVPELLMPQKVIEGFSGLKKSNDTSTSHSHLALPDSSQEQSCRVTTGQLLVLLTGQWKGSLTFPRTTQKETFHKDEEMVAGKRATPI